MESIKEYVNEEFMIYGPIVPIVIYGCGKHLGEGNRANAVTTNAILDSGTMNGFVDDEFAKQISLRNLSELGASSAPGGVRSYEAFLRSETMDDFTYAELTSTVFPEGLKGRATLILGRTFMQNMVVKFDFAKSSIVLAKR